MPQQHPSQRPAEPMPERSSTVLETDDDLRQAMISSVRIPQPTQPSPRAAATVLNAPAAPAAAPPPEIAIFRPTIRPPVPLLCVFDDGKTDGELIRIRDYRFIIGRTEGDYRIPIDERMSSRHVEISLRSIEGKHRWVVTDLQSKHGMFVRVSRTALADQAEFLVGNGRYIFENSQDPTERSDSGPSNIDCGQTQGWSGSTASFRPPTVTELLGNGVGNRILLVRDEYWIGLDPTCQVSRPDDPFCERRHARLYRDSKGVWHVEHNKTQNGLWVRMSQIPVDSVLYFQVGEQRFRLKV